MNRNKHISSILNGFFFLQYTFCHLLWQIPYLIYLFDRFKILKFLLHWKNFWLHYGVMVTCRRVTKLNINHINLCSKFHTDQIIIKERTCTPDFLPVAATKRQSWFILWSLASQWSRWWDQSRYKKDFGEKGLKGRDILGVSFDNSDPFWLEREIIEIRESQYSNRIKSPTYIHLSFMSGQVWLHLYL